jgi:cytochrome b561
MITDTQEAYGIVSRILHWGMALAVFALFGLGWWMVGLDY